MDTYIPVESGRYYSELESEPVESLEIDLAHASPYEHDDGQVDISFCNSRLSHADGPGFGYEFSLTPDAARQLAAQLVEAADKVEQG